MPHILMDYFIHRYLFHRPWYIIEPSFICCQVHYSRMYVLILAMTPGLDCETSCVTVGHVIPLNVTAPLSYRILILLLKEFSSMVFNLGPCRGLNINSPVRVIASLILHQASIHWTTLPRHLRTFKMLPITIWVVFD